MGLPGDNSSAISINEHNDIVGFSNMGLVINKKLQASPNQVFIISETNPDNLMTIPKNIVDLKNSEALCINNKRKILLIEKIGILSKNYIFDLNDYSIVQIPQKPDFTPAKLTELEIVYDNFYYSAPKNNKLYSEVKDIRNLLINSGNYWIELERVVKINDLGKGIGMARNIYDEFQAILIAPH